jgi:formylglycine-generating enzyme required for sulfatase activity
MSRKTDLEGHIHASYDLILKYEAILQTSSDPKEQARARRAIEEQWGLVAGYLEEYRSLAGGALPDAVAQIAARFDTAPGAPIPAISSLDTPEADAARERYRAALRERYNAVETHAFTALAEDERVGSPRRLPLLGEGSVYIPLTFDAPAAGQELAATAGGSRPEKTAARLRTQAERETAPLTLARVLALPGHLAIVGDAGSGKTTLLHVLVTALAATARDDPIPPEIARALPGPRPLPVLLPLRLFEHACGRALYRRCAGDLLRFLDIWFAEWCQGTALPAHFLADHVRAGRAWLLLDALDEVADPGHRQTVRNVIHELAHAFPGTRLIVTARLAGYRGARLDDRFSVVHVRDLDDDQRARMIRAIYHGLALSNAERRADDLLGRFQASEQLRALGRTPVMVWTAAVIHALRGRLPESRAALYDGYVDILLRHSFKRGHYDTQAVEELSDGLGWPLQERRHYLTYAAFEVHRMLEGQPERRGDRRPVVGEDELADRILARYFRRNLMLDVAEARRRARDFVSLMVAHSGLLFETPQGYTVGDHLTMQEFLAGCYLGDHYAWEDEAGYRALLQEKVGASWWREVFILAAGYLATQPGFAARNFIQRLAEQGESAVERLAALALAARALLQLRGRRQQPTWYAGLAGRLAGALYQSLYAEPVPAPTTLRQEAGLALGLLHGEPGAGETADPRFPHPAGTPDFIPIPAGWFWMGQDGGPEEDERPCHPVFLHRFELARFPTTNAMFARFMLDGGYRERRWWEEARADGRWKDGKIRDYAGERDRPAYWDDARFNNPAQPVVGVTWYEAAAYCRWLGATLGDGYRYHLPTEAQWERAARGPSAGTREPAEVPRDVWTYPWGEAWVEDRCNSQEAGLETTSPVGLFPAGATASGIADMAGNVWEWCSDRYAADYYARSKGTRNPSGPEAGGLRVLRGGSWANEGPKMCRCGMRLWDGPDVGLNYGGFRCARTLSS